MKKTLKLMAIALLTLGLFSCGENQKKITLEELKEAQSALFNENGIMDEEDEFLDRIPVGKLGFYTDDPDVFEARMAEIEADLDEVEAGFEDPDKWITSEQMHKDFLKMFPWLR